MKIPLHEADVISCKCAALICDTQCPLDITEAIENKFPDVCFQCFYSQTENASELCPYIDIFLAVSAKNIVGIERDWLSTSMSLSSISLSKRRVHISVFDTDLVTPNWEEFAHSFTARGAQVLRIN
jgi:hypothetical protein